jgi:hypothetical protein
MWHFGRSISFKVPASSTNEVDLIDIDGEHQQQNDQESYEVWYDRKEK